MCLYNPMKRRNVKQKDPRTEPCGVHVGSLVCLAEINDLASISLTLLLSLKSFRTV